MAKQNCRVPSCGPRLRCLLGPRPNLKNHPVVNPKDPRSRGFAKAGSDAHAPSRETGNGKRAKRLHVLLVELPNHLEAPAWIGQRPRAGLSIFVDPRGEKRKRLTHTVDGCEIHFAPPKTPWLKPLFATVFTGDHIILGFLSFVHPQY